MDFESMLGRAAAILPADWSDGMRMAVVAAAVFVCFVVPAVMLLAAFGKKRAPVAASVGGATIPAVGHSGARAAPILTAVSDLDPDEWVSGNVIHYDRQKSFGYIRCDRVKGHVRFEAADFKRAPRVGEMVRFKGRHGARRKPVADFVERLPGAKRAS